MKYNSTGVNLSTKLRYFVDQRIPTDQQRHEIQETKLLQYTDLLCALSLSPLGKCLTATISIFSSVHRLSSS